MFNLGRDRVVPRFECRGLWAAAILIGVAYGAMMVLFVDSLFEWAVSRWPVAGIVVGVHLVVLPWVLIGVLLGRSPCRVRTCIGLAVVMNIGVFVANLLGHLTRVPGFGAQAGIPVPDWRVGLAFAATTGIVIAATLLGRWFGRLLFGAPIEQTEPPRLCWACGYERGSADPCPECGVALAGSRPRGRVELGLWRLARRVAVPALVLAVVAWFGYASWRIRADYLPTRAYLRVFDAAKGWEPAYAYIDHLYGAVASGSGGRFFNSIGRTQDLGDGSGRMIQVSYWAMAPRGLPVMQVRICAEATLPAGWPAGTERFVDWGTPATIVADLNREQAERVIREGLPRGLVEAIVAKADELGWKAAGGINAMGGQRVEIDPAPHFAGNAQTSDE